MTFELTVGTSRKKLYVSRLSYFDNKTMAKQNQQKGEREELEERCVDLLTEVAWLRSSYPEHLRKKDVIIAKMEATLLAREVRRRLHTDSVARDEEEIHKLPSDYNVVRQDVEKNAALVERMEKLKKVVDQIRSDDIHILTREGIDVEAITNKIKALQSLQ